MVLSVYMKSRFLLFLFGCVSLCALFTPYQAQEKGKEGSSETRSVLLKESYKAGEKFIALSSDATYSKFDLTFPEGRAGGFENLMEAELIEYEILNVNDQGMPTKFRKTWHHSREASREVDPFNGKTGEEIEMSDSPLAGVVILYTFDSENETWESKLEKGEKDKAEREGKRGEVQKALDKQIHFERPFFRSEESSAETKVGETWEIEESLLEKVFSDQKEEIELQEAQGTCHAREIVVRDGIEFLVIDYRIEGKMKIKEESLNNPLADFVLEGSVDFNLSTSRISRGQIESEANAEGLVEQALPIDIKILTATDARHIQDSLEEVEKLFGEPELHDFSARLESEEDASSENSEESEGEEAPEEKQEQDF